MCTFGPNRAHPVPAIDLAVANRAESSNLAVLCMPITVVETGRSAVDSAD
jgi:hypothetical protein